MLGVFGANDIKISISSFLKKKKKNNNLIMYMITQVTGSQAESFAW